LGVDDNTGAGGANVWTHQDFLDNWPDGPFTPLPAGAQFRVALRRSLRVADRSGQPVEDLGVIPDNRHRLTDRDLIDDNADLMEAAGASLAGATPWRLDVDVTGQTATATTMEVTTAAVTSLDVYVNQRPVGTTAVAGGTTTLVVPVGPADTAVVRIEGYDGADLVAARTLTFGA
jgi:hypothetical protein